MARRIQKLFIANRGEIAVRIMRTCREMGIRTVAVYSDPDAKALHVEHADEAYRLQGSKASETYLNQARILEIARSASADAIHPGYGFLSENPGFSKAVEEAGIIFVGPTAGAIGLLGDKTAARSLASKLGIPTIPGSPGAHRDKEDALTFARKTGFPVLLKAAAGGGGKGMRIVHSEADFSAAFAMAASEAQNAFGDPRVYVERYISDPHHVEIQILSDVHGNAVWLGERDCSIQRRHQKIIEESPSPVIDDDLRSTMGGMAVKLARQARYSSAGTVEFLVDRDKNFFFLEVNTRLQVEHPVTELLTGIDLVHEQIVLAEGNRLAIRQQDVTSRGHAIECRIYAEDTFNEFFPSIGDLKTFEIPSGPGVRVDSGARAGDKVEVYYDPMLAKVITWGRNRPSTIQTMKRALEEFIVSGLHTTIPFCLYILQHDSFVKGKHSTQLIQKDLLAHYMKYSEGNDMVTDAAAIMAALMSQSARIGMPDTERNGSVREQSKWRERRVDFYR